MISQFSVEISIHSLQAVVCFGKTTDGEERKERICIGGQ
jgi:hypothetical protein